MSRKEKEKSLRNTLINIVATLLIILSLLLIFNAPIRKHDYGVAYQPISG